MNLIIYQVIAVRITGSYWDYKPGNIRAVQIRSDETPLKRVKSTAGVDYCVGGGEGRFCVDLTDTLYRPRRNVDKHRLPRVKSTQSD